MPTYMVVGGQFGSEGKGKVINQLCERQTNYFAVVRTGGANSGHTTKGIDGNDIIVKQLPSAVHDDRANLYIAAGCVINKDILLQEIALCKISPHRLVIDPRAAVINSGDRDYERGALIDTIGSTASGTGRAMARRMMRGEDVILAEHVKEFRDVAYIRYVAKDLHAVHARGGTIIVEGTQGYGLSLLHGYAYPYVTSRDVTASGFASEIGLPPCMIDDVIVTIRALPIRVGGNSGPTGAPELTWEQVRERSGAPEVEQEYTSVTNRLRRVFEFDMGMVCDAVRHNGAHMLAVMGVDRLDWKNRGVRNIDELTHETQEWLRWVEKTTKCTIGYIGTGPRNEDIFEP